MVHLPGAVPLRLTAPGYAGLGFPGPRRLALTPSVAIDSYASA